MLYLEASQLIESVTQSELSRGIRGEQGHNVLGDLIIKHFVGENQDFECYALSDGQPVQLFEDNGNVIKFLTIQIKAGSCILNALESFDVTEPDRPAKTIKQ